MISQLSFFFLTNSPYVYLQIKQELDLSRFTNVHAVCYFNSYKI